MQRRSTEPGRLRLREVREVRRMTQEELSARAGVSLDHVRRLEVGLHQPRPRTLRRLADALAVDVLDLVAEERDPP